MMRVWGVMLVLALAGCGGAKTPESVSAHDEAACRDTATTTVNRQNAKRALDWFSSPVRRWGQINEASESCMLAKGHPQVRWCTPAEMAQAQQAGRVVVTSSGVHCLSLPKG